VPKVHNTDSGLSCGTPLKNQKTAANGRRQNANEELRHEEHVNEVNVLYASKLSTDDKQRSSVVRSSLLAQQEQPGVKQIQSDQFLE
jgi:hypothetical protein